MPGCLPIVSFCTSRHTSRAQVIAAAPAVPARIVVAAQRNVPLTNARMPRPVSAASEATAQRVEDQVVMNYQDRVEYAEPPPGMIGWVAVQTAGPPYPVVMMVPHYEFAEVERRYRDQGLELIPTLVNRLPVLVPTPMGPPPSYTRE